MDNRPVFHSPCHGDLALLVIYLWHDGPGLFLCEDAERQLYVGYWTANVVPGDYVSYLFAKTSIEKAQQLEVGDVDVFNFFMDALEDAGGLDYLYFASDGVSPLLPDLSDNIVHEHLDIKIVPDLLPDPGVALDGNTFDVLVSSPVSATIR